MSLNQKMLGYLEVAFELNQVGGEARNTILAKHMAAGGRVGICGGISSYGNLDGDTSEYCTQVSQNLTATGL